MTTVKINGMSCQHCVASVTKAIEDVSGVSQVSVDLDKGEATYDGEVDQLVIKEAITMHPPARRGYVIKPESLYSSGPVTSVRMFIR